ncbi:MAG: HAD family hydrolase [Spirochaetales bacterium]|nr:HAD family hydrolase [Spirochaetales bacterium]
MTHPCPAALLFDLDDTLVLFDGTTKEAWTKTCALFAPEIGRDPQELYDAIRAHARHYWSDPDRHREGRLMLEEARRRLVIETLRKIGAPDDTFAARLADHYSALQESLIDFLPGVEETLAFFKGKGTRLALLTNGNAVLQRRKIERFGLDRFFSHFFVEGELGFGKPDPRVYERALAALNARPEEAWCVGDNLEWDVAGAQACGIFGVWKDTYRRGLGESPVRPDRIILELGELAESVGA